MARFDLVAFDVDGTLVEHPEEKTVWEVLNARFVGGDDLNRERYADYRAGRLSYAEWVSLDVGGNFGTNNRVYVESGLVLWAARKLGPPSSTRPPAPRRC